MHRIIEMFDKNVNINELNGSVLAYLGDNVFELFVRTKLVLEKQRKLKELNDEAKNYVKASMQADAYKRIESMLTEEEIEIYKRGRNTNGNISSKSATAVDYRMATGLETLVGYLYLKEDYDRLIFIMKKILDNNK